MDSQNPDSQLKGITGGKTKFIVIAIVIVVIIAGLGIYLATSSSQVNKKEITILVGSGSYTCEYITQVAKNFENTHPGYTVKITTAGYSSLLTSEESALKGKSSSPSIIMYYASQAAALSPLLYNLPTTGPNSINVSNFLTGNMFSGGYQIATNGTILKTIGVPIHTVLGYNLVYQKSIFNNKTLQTEFMNEYHFSFNPRTYKNFTALQDAAQFISQNTKFNGKDNDYALMFPDSSHHSMIDAFYNMLYPYVAGNKTTGVPANSSANYWTYFGNVNGKFLPSFNNTQGIKALRMYKNLTQYEPSVSVQPIGYSQQEEYFATGDYAMGVAWSSFFPTYSSNSSKVANNYSVALMPGGFTGYSPTFLGVNPYATNTSLAVEFLNYATSPSQYKMGLTEFSFLPGTYSGLSEAANMTGFSWIHSFLNYSKNITLNKQYASIITALSPLFPTLIPDMNTQILNYFEGKTTAASALSTAYNEWENAISTDDLTL